jgi:hypothetical protein
VLETICSLAKEVQINPREFLLDKNKVLKIALQVSAKNGSVKGLKKIWEWTIEAKLNPYTYELKDKLLQAKDKDGYTVRN